MSDAVQNIEAAQALNVYDSADRKGYQERTAANQAQFRADLADEFAYDLPKVVSDEIYTMAWAEGHSSGYGEVAHHYNDFAEFARRVVAAVK